jgi:hypothetical protein
MGSRDTGLYASKLTQANNEIMLINQIINQWLPTSAYIIAQQRSSVHRVDEYVIRYGGVCQVSDFRSRYLCTLYNIYPATV